MGSPHTQGIQSDRSGEIILMIGSSVIDNRISIGNERSEHLEVSATLRDIRLEESYETDK